MQEYIQFKLSILKDFKVRVKKQDVQYLNSCKNEIQADNYCKQLILNKLDKIK